MSEKKVLTLQSREYPMPERIKALLKLHESYSPTVALGRALSATRVYKETEGEPTIIRRAKVVKDYCENKNIYIQENELLAGENSSFKS